MHSKTEVLSRYGYMIYRSVILCHSGFSAMLWPFTHFYIISYIQGRRHGGGGRGEIAPPPLWFSFSPSVPPPSYMLIMIIPLTHYVNFATAFFRLKKKCVGVPAERLFLDLATHSFLGLAAQHRGTLPPLTKHPAGRRPWLHFHPASYKVDPHHIKDAILIHNLTLQR